MLLDKHGLADKLNTGKVAVGYDLGNSVSQISYCFMHKDEPETVSTVAGEERYHIPTVLCKRLESNQWLYGKDAMQAAEAGKGILISDLVELAYKGIPVVVEEDEFDPVALLALFVKKSLSLLQMIVPYEKIQVFMMTVRRLDPRMVEVLSGVAQALELKTNKVYLESYKESFYYYTIHQPQDLWLRDVLVCDYSEEYMRINRLEMNPRTKPIVAYVEETEYVGMRQPQLRDGNISETEAARLDKDFEEIINEMCDGRFVSAAYLIGNGFLGDWSKESLRTLCRGRRVFRGNNLYSKGACYAAREKLIPSDAAKKRVFLGDDKLKANIGMRVVRRGEASYLALLDAGVSWYESRKEVEFLLESGNSFLLTITPLNGKEARNIEIELTDLPKRPDMTTRLNMTIKMLSEKKVKVVVQDMGFGDLFRSGGACFEEEFEL